MLERLKMMFGNLWVQVSLAAILPFLTFIPKIGVFFKIAFVIMYFILLGQNLYYEKTAALSGYTEEVINGFNRSFNK